MSAEAGSSRMFEGSRGRLSEENVRAVLEADFQSGCVVESRGGKISRSYYANVLGCSRAALWHFLFVFDEYEQKLRLKVGEMRLSATERKLRNLLDQDCKAGRIVPSRGRKISRLHYASLLGCTSSALTPYISVFSEYEQKLGWRAGPPSGNARGTISEDALRRVLDKDLGTKKGVISRRGKISRRHYSSLLGWSPATMTQFISVFSEYEAKLGLKASTRIAGKRGHLSEEKLRDLLQGDFSSGRIVNFRGKVSRKYYSEKLGCSPSSLNRFKDVFEEYNQKIAAREIAILTDKLRMVLESDLASDNVVTGKSGEVNRSFYAKKIDCSPSKLSEIGDVFSEFDEKLPKKVSAVSESKIRDLLERDLQNGTVVQRQAGKIFRRHYAGLLGCPEYSLTPFISVFTEYEFKLGLRSDAVHVPESRNLIEGKVREVIEKDFRDQSIVFSQKGRIKRSHYAKLVGCSPSSMSRFRSLFSDYEKKLGVDPEIVSGGVRGAISEEKIRALLERDRESNCVATSRGGKISRRYYANLLGCSPSALSRFGFLFSEYEEKFSIVTGPLVHLSQMREWFSEEYSAGRIDVRDGKLDRLEFQKRFELSGSNHFTRYPEIRELIEEFDSKAEREEYQPLDKREELTRVKAVLDDRPSLNKDRLTINQTELARVANVSINRLREKLFTDAILKRQAEILTEAQESRIDPYVHGRVFPFSELLPVWPVRFLERVGVRFKLVAASFSAESVKNPYLSFLELLAWLPTNQNPPCQAVVSEVRSEGRVLSVGEWEDTLFAFRDHLIGQAATGAISESLADNKISALRIMLNGFVSVGLFPETSVLLPGIKYAGRRRGHRQSVAEVNLQESNEVADYVGFAQDIFVEVCRDSGTDIGLGGGGQFIAVLALEIGKLKKQLPVEPSAAVLWVLEKRLDALRERATAIVASSIKSYESGREALLSAILEGEEFEKAYLATAGNTFQRSLLVRKYFPHPRDASEDQVKKGFSNLLSLIEQRHEGIPPAGSGANTGPLGQFYAKRYLENGGLKSIAPMLNPGPDTVAAILTLYLIESGANISVGRTLDFDCIEESDLTGHSRITGYKARAKGKPIIVDLPESSPAVRAMKWLQAANGRLRAQAGEEADRMFLMQIGQRVQLMTPHWYTAWFKKIASTVPSLEGANLVPNMIRPSVLLHAALTNEGKLSTGMAIGQHSVQVTQGYQQKWPSRLLYDQNIRRFQTSVETLLMASVEDAASKLGVTVEEFEERLGELRPTGLGTFCRDQRGREGEKQETCSTMDCWNNCPHLLIVAEVEAMAALRLWRAALERARPEWERDRPERWDEVWLPWLCLTTVVEEKMVRGPMVKIWKAAEKRAAEISAQPGYIAPRPW